MAGIRTCDRESQVQRPNDYTTEPPPIRTNCSYNYDRMHAHEREGYISTSGLKSEVTIVFLDPDFF